MDSNDNQNVKHILSFWFDHSDPINRWFKPSPALDQEIATQFSNLVSQARTTTSTTTTTVTGLKTWTHAPESTLALLLLLLDQFPRNIYRSTSAAYASDALALQTATRAIALGFDRQVPLLHQQFFYLPLMHDETLLSQVAAAALYEAYAMRCDKGSEVREGVEGAREFGKRHLSVIERFGRFPSRNLCLGRESTGEEREFLGRHPDGF